MILAPIGSRGSSPLSRGIPVLDVGVAACHRIIPALAGNTPRHTPSTIVRRDHPRSRGEYAMALAKVDLAPGSSPLSRGIRAQDTSLDLDRRIIPALAGNTTAREASTVRRRDHPRSRGEYALGLLEVVTHVGSSPLSRGIRGHLRPCAGAYRIIPALAGNTTANLRYKTRCSDHPRSRGEYG